MIVGFLSSRIPFGVNEARSPWDCSMRWFGLNALGIILLLFSSCAEKPEILPDESQSILFLGHIYQESNKIDPRLDKINFRDFDQIWLGGDICSETTEKKSTLAYLDRQFDLSHAGTHWAMGNHDVRNGNLEWIKEKTGREFTYFEVVQDLGIFVLNTNWEENDCEELETQFTLLKSVTDTINELSHLIILSHHVIWGELIEGQNMWETANANRPSWQSRCEIGSEFEKLIYPLLERVQEKDVQVVCMAGDFGQRVKQFEYLDQSGIWFLGAGFNKGLSKELDEDDSAILLDYSPLTKELNWNFLTIGELSE